MRLPFHACDRKQLRSLRRLRKALSNLITRDVCMTQNADTAPRMGPLLGKEQQFSSEQRCFPAARYCVEIPRTVFEQCTAALVIIEVQVLGQRRQRSKVFDSKAYCTHSLAPWAAVAATVLGGVAIADCAAAT